MATINLTAAEANLLVAGLESEYSNLTMFEPYDAEERRWINAKLDLMQSLKDRLLPIARKETT